VNRKNRLDVVAGFCDGILTALTLAAGKMLDSEFSGGDRASVPISTLDKRRKLAMKQQSDKMNLVKGPQGH
jgi:hypothetical protein